MFDNLIAEEKHDAEFFKNNWRDEVITYERACELHGNPFPPVGVAYRHIDKLTDDEKQRLVQDIDIRIKDYKSDIKTKQAEIKRSNATDKSIGYGCYLTRGFRADCRKDINKMKERIEHLNKIRETL